MVAFQALSGAIIWGQGVLGAGLAQCTPLRQYPEEREGQQEDRGGWGEASLESISKVPCQGRRTQGSQLVTATCHLPAYLSRPV